MTDLLETDAHIIADFGAVVVRVHQCADLVRLGGQPFDNFICWLNALPCATALIIWLRRGDLTIPRSCSTFLR
jgi:hypothetical protein